MFDYVRQLSGDPSAYTHAELVTAIRTRHQELEARGEGFAVKIVSAPIEAYAVHQYGLMTQSASRTPQSTPARKPKAVQASTSSSATASPGQTIPWNRDVSKLPNAGKWPAGFCKGSDGSIKFAFFNDLCAAVVTQAFGTRRGWFLVRVISVF